MLPTILCVCVRVCVCFTPNTMYSRPKPLAWSKEKRWWFALWDEWNWKWFLDWTWDAPLCTRQKTCGCRAKGCKGECCINVVLQPANRVFRVMFVSHVSLCRHRQASSSAPLKWTDIKYERGQHVMLIKLSLTLSWIWWAAIYRRHELCINPTAVVSGKISSLFSENLTMVTSEPTRTLSANDVPANVGNQTLQPDRLRRARPSGPQSKAAPGPPPSFTPLDS